MSVEQIIYIVFGVWLLLLTAGFYWVFSRFRNLTKDKKGKSLTKILEDTLVVEKKNTKEIKKLIKKIAQVEEESTLHVQKVSLVRFNPFSEIGGDHSFSMALLNGHDTGIVITGLHTRERTRMYVKPIKKGKSDYELSEEEKKAINKARRGRII